MAHSALEKLAEAIEAGKERLSDLDSEVGDADHGINMNRGMKRTAEKIRGKNYADIGSLYRDVAMTLMGAVGGSAGPLYGTFFMKLAQELSGKREVPLAVFACAMREGLDGVMRLGKAAPGDKTMVDTLAPAIEALLNCAEQGDGIAWNMAVGAAEQGMKGTASMTARRGRSSYAGERSLGRQDAGATSSFYLIVSFRDASLEG